MAGEGSVFTTVADATAAAAVSSALSAVISADVEHRTATCRWVALEVGQALGVLEDSAEASRETSKLRTVRSALTCLAVGSWDEARRALIDARRRLMPQAF
jgi:hypothetical protein